MKYLLCIINDLKTIDSVNALHCFFNRLLQDLNYASCLLHINTSNQSSIFTRDIGYASQTLQQQLQNLYDTSILTETAIQEVFHPLNKIKNGYAMKINQPVSAQLILELKNKVSQKRFDAIQLFWQLLLPSIENCLMKIAVANQHFQLTSREQECVMWASANKTSWEISRILGISERTVNFHIQNSLQKSGAINRGQLIKLCQEHKIIN